MVIKRNHPPPRQPQLQGRKSAAPSAERLRGSDRRPTDTGATRARGGGMRCAFSGLLLCPAIVRLASGASCLRSPDQHLRASDARRDRCHRARRGTGRRSAGCRGCRNCRCSAPRGSGRVRRNRPRCRYSAPERRHVRRQFAAGVAHRVRAAVHRRRADVERRRVGRRRERMAPVREMHALPSASPLASGPSRARNAATASAAVVTRRLAGAVLEIVRRLTLEQAAASPVCCIVRSISRAGRWRASTRRSTAP